MAKRQTTKSKAEELLRADLTAAGYPPKVGHAFHAIRGWELDLAYPSLMLAIEVDGSGRHGTGKGQRDDCEKINAAIEHHWRVLRYPARSVTTNCRRENIVQQIIRVICQVQCEVSSSEVLNG